ncbi:MAG TPA: hypothetical protein VIV11_24440 [Kofleriaceae bacterium]
MRTLGTIALSLVTAAGCASEAVEEDLIEVDDTKADDYYSNVSAEWEVRGAVKIKMTDAEYNDQAKRKDLVSRRLTAVGLYLTAYVTDKFHGIDINNNGTIEDSEVFFRNEGYGGFHAMVRTQSGEAGTLKKLSDGLYEIAFELDLAGPKNLTQLLPRSGTTTPFKFELKMPEFATVDPNSVPRGEIRAWKPETATGPVESNVLGLVRLPTPKNAYPQYAEFVKDGVYDITMVFGHDYNTPRSDVQEIKEAYSHLVARGFKSPVANFDALKANSGPFTIDVKAGGKDVKIEVRLFYADMFEGQRPAQKQLVIDELVKRDVFFYNGHAGPYYGFYVDANKEASVGYLELAMAPFTAKQQLVIAQGCQTYSQYADMVYASPVKDETNLDVITTVNYSYGVGTLDLFDSLTTLQDKRHTPVDAYAIVEQLNGQWINNSYEVFYGIMGITANPAVHPYAALDKIGVTCTQASDCGDPDANLCIKKRVDATKKVCAAKAVASKCPTGTYFKQLRQGETIVAAGCVK